MNVLIWTPPNCVCAHSLHTDRLAAFSYKRERKIKQCITYWFLMKTSILKSLETSHRVVRNTRAIMGTAYPVSSSDILSNYHVLEQPEYCHWCSQGTEPFIHPTDPSCSSFIATIYLPSLCSYPLIPNPWWLQTCSHFCNVIISTKL